MRRLHLTALATGLLLLGAPRADAQQAVPDAEARAAALDHPAGWMWTGATVQENGVVLRKAVPPVSATTSYGARSGAARAERPDPRATAEELLGELARARLLLQVERDFAAAGRALEEAWQHAAWSHPYEGREDVLVQVALARSELLQARGREAEARAALDRLLPGPETVGAEPDARVFVPADVDTLATMSWALQDPRLEERRRALEGGGAHGAPATLEDVTVGKVDDELFETVYVALQSGHVESLERLGAATAPALAELARRSVGQYFTDWKQDPLYELVKVAPGLAARTILDGLERGGLLWRSRAMSAMLAGRVLDEPVAWNRAVEPPLLREPIWIEVLERLSAHDDALPRLMRFVNQLTVHDAVTPTLSDAAVRALGHDEPQIVSNALEELATAKPVPSMRRVYESVLHAPSPQLRAFGAERLSRSPELGALQECSEHPDRDVRRLLLQGLFLRREVPAAFLPQICTLLGDPDPELRIQALRSTLREAEVQALLPEPTVRALAADPAVSVREMVPLLQLQDRGLRAELLTALAADPEQRVVSKVDGVLADGLARSEPALWLPVLRARWLHPDLPPPVEDDSAVVTRMVSPFLRAPEGLRGIVRLQQETGDAFLLRLLLVVMQGREDVTQELSGLSDDELFRVLESASTLAEEQADTRGGVQLGGVWYRLGESERRPLDVFARLAGGKEQNLWCRLASVRELVARDDERGEALLRECLRPELWPEGAMTRDVASMLNNLGSTLAAKRGGDALLAVLREERLYEPVQLELAARFDSRTPAAPDIALTILQRWFAPDGTANEESDAVEGAISFSAAMPERADSDALVRALRVRRYAAKALRAMIELRRPEFLRPLAECLDAEWMPSTQREGFGVRAAHGIALYLSDDAAELLLAGVERTSLEAVQEACYNGLERIRRYQDERRTLARRRAGVEQREESIARLAALLADGDPLVVAAAARGLATLDAVEQLPALVELLRSKDERVRAAAQEALDVLNRREPSDG